MTWKVKFYECNQNVIKDYDIFGYSHWLDVIKDLKRKCSTREEFAATLRTKLMSQYWSRCEYELIIARHDGRIVLYPWVGCRDIATATVDVTDDTSFDWAGFADKHINRQVTKTNAKVDIWDQIEYRWDEFINYCLTAKIPYDRNKNKFILEDN